MGRSLPLERAGNLGAVDPVAIAEVAEESWPVVRDADELHDALLTLVWLPEEQAGTWGTYLPALIEAGRATIVAIHKSKLKIHNVGPPSRHASPVESHRRDPLGRVTWVARPLKSNSATG